MPTISGTSGRDTLEGTSGSDKINAGDGNDLLYYSLPSNNIPASVNTYSGGGGIDMVALRFSYDQWFNQANQSQLTNYFNWRSNVKINGAGEISNGLSSDFTFQFGDSTLKIQMMEQLGVMVDGRWLGGDFSVYDRRGPVARDDQAAITEDSDTIVIDVLNSSNPGESDTVQDLVSDLSLVSGPAHGEVTLVKSSTKPGDWRFQYAPDNSHYQYLRSGEFASDQFTYQVTDVNGKTATATVSISVAGVDDRAILKISAGSQFSVKEDQAVTTAIVRIVAKDADADESYVQPQTAIQGTYGSFTMDVEGNYSYVIDNGRSAVQSLLEGEKKEDVFTVQSKDGSATTNLVFTVEGTNDIAEITGDSTYELTEDINPDDNNFLTVTGQLSVSDADQEQSQFNTTVISAEDNLGELILQEDGSFSYAIDNAEIQYLKSGDEREETFTITSLDGSASRDITFVIRGVDDNTAPVANPDVFWVTGNTMVTFLTSALLQNDTDAESGKENLRIVNFSPVGNSGFLPVLSQDNGSFSFDAGLLNLNEVYNFKYTIADESGVNDESTVTIKLTPPGSEQIRYINLSAEAYAGAYLVGDDYISGMYAGAGDSTLIGSIGLKNFLSGASGGDVLSIGGNEEINKKYSIYIASEDNQDSPDLIYDAIEIFKIDGNTLIGGSMSSENFSPDNYDRLSIGESLKLTTRVEAAAIVAENASVALSAEAKPVLVQSIEKNNLYGDSANLNSIIGDNDVLGVGNKIQIKLSAQADSIASPVASALATVAPDLSVGLSENFLFGDGVTINGGKGGNDMLSLGESIRLSVDAAVTTHPLWDGELAAPAASVSVAILGADLAIASNDLYGDSATMSRTEGGDDILNLANDLGVDLRSTISTQMTDLDLFFTKFEVTLSINDNDLYGDAYEMVESIGGDDKLSFGQGYTVNFSQVDQLSMNIELSMNIVDNNLYGDAFTMTASRGGNDILLGSGFAGGTTYLTGDSVFSDVNSRGGNDRLISGRGNDHMWGDFGGKAPKFPSIKGVGGADIFEFSGIIGQDVIYDFQDGKDKIELKGFSSITKFSDIAGRISASDERAIIKIDASNTITLVGLPPSALNASDFIFST